MRNIYFIFSFIFGLLFIGLVGCPNDTKPASTTTTIAVGSIRWLSDYMKTLEPTDDAYDIVMTDLSPDLTEIKKVLDKYKNINVNLDLSQCTGLKSVDGFNRSANLKGITIPIGVTTIVRMAFKNCTDLTSVTIPQSVTSIGVDAFYECSSLTNLIIPDSFTESDFSGNLTSTTFSGCLGPVYNSHTFFRLGSTYEGSFEIPDGIKDIASNAFKKCTKLTAISIPDTVESIGAQAFSGCKGLTSVEIPDSVTEIKGSAFEDCTNLKNVSLGNGLKYIYNFAFCFCSLESIIIPASVEGIYDGNPFAGCNYLTKITVDENNTVYDSRNNCNAIIYTRTNNLISGCSKTIIPNTVAIINNNAFWQQTRLESLTIPASVTKIDDTFFYCNKIETMYVNATTPPTFGGFHSYNTSIPTIYVPSSSLSAYKSADGWSKYANKIVGR